MHYHELLLIKDLVEEKLTDEWLDQRTRLTLKDILAHIEKETREETQLKVDEIIDGQIDEIIINKHNGRI